MSRNFLSVSSVVVWSWNSSLKLLELNAARIVKLCGVGSAVFMIIVACSLRLRADMRIGRGPIWIWLYGLFLLGISSLLFLVVP